MVNLDSRVVNVALPMLQHQFSVSIESLQRVITAYLLDITGLLPVTGRIADAVGRRKVFLVGIATFTAGSLLDVISLTFTLLVLARAFQARRSHHHGQRDGDHHRNLPPRQAQTNVWFDWIGRGRGHLGRSSVGRDPNRLAKLAQHLLDQPSRRYLGSLGIMALSPTLCP